MQRRILRRAAKLCIIGQFIIRAVIVIVQKRVEQVNVAKGAPHHKRWHALLCKRPSILPLRENLCVAAPVNTAAMFAQQCLDDWAQDRIIGANNRNLRIARCNGNRVQIQH